MVRASRTRVNSAQRAPRYNWPSHAVPRQDRGGHHGTSGIGLAGALSVVVVLLSPDRARYGAPDARQRADCHSGAAPPMDLSPSVASV